MTNEYAMELRCTLARACTHIYGTECDTNTVIIGSPDADITVRAAFVYDCDASELASELISYKPRCCGTEAIRCADVVGKYINITLSNEYLERVADIIIAKYPYPTEIRDTRYDYAIARACMLSRKEADFSDLIGDTDIRQAFMAIIYCDEKSAPRAAEIFLKAEENAHFDGLGKIADVAARVLFRYRKENKI